MATTAEKKAAAEEKRIEKAAERAYYEEAKEWESEKYSSARGRARVWAWIAGLSLMVTCMCLTALMLILPLKEVVPYVIEVDRASGMVEVKRPITEQGISESEAITKFFIVAYLNAREAYLYDRAQVDYVKVQKMSSAEVASRHYAWFQPSNEESPLNRFGKKGTVDIEIRNVSFIDKDTVSIPIKRTERTKGTIREIHEVVTLSFKYQQDPASEEDRFINPLGFQVTAYRKDPLLVEE